ncbi:MAG TPA: hypothetical protein VGL36_36430 [Kribbella sp.]
MGMKSGLARIAVRRLHVLVAEVPGFWLLRVMTERAIVARGWVRALSPAEADALVVCGIPGSELSGAIDLVWEQLPGPRARTVVESGETLQVALDSLVLILRDSPPETRASTETVEHGKQSSPDHGAMDHEAMSHGAMDHGAMGHGAMGHDAMGHGGMAPAGIRLARGRSDRDGLEMDVLHVPLGPVLPYWPPGLVLRCVLHGDVIAEAVPTVLPGGVPPIGPDPASPRLRAARWCDVVTGVLALAGWQQAAADARRVTQSLAAAEGNRMEASLVRLHRQVSRSRLLRWSLRDLGMVNAPHAPTHLVGDVHERLLAALLCARDELTGERRGPAGAPSDMLPSLVSGLDLGAARLVIASLGLDAHAETAAHG